MTTLATAGTALLSLSFVFATTCQEVLGSCIFLFVKHPFDIGDRVDISSDPLIVERISLLYTVFKRVQSGKTVQVPNIVLNGLWIDNITRSKAMREQISVFCAFDTSFDDISLLKGELQSFVLDKENNRDFQPELDVEVLSIAEMNKMELKVEIRHKSNWANESIRAARRSKFMCALVLALRKVPIYGPGGGDPPIGTSDRPSYSVALAPEVAQANKTAFAAAKDAKRMVPAAPAPIPEANAAYSTGMQQPDYLAVQNLHARNAAVDSQRDETWAARDDTSDMPRSSLDDISAVDGTQSERGLLREQSKASTVGRRAANQTLGHSSSVTSAYHHHQAMPRGHSNVTYAHPPVPNRAVAANAQATETMNAQTAMTNNAMMANARADAFDSTATGQSMY
jgi:Mechanosensitive ion channel